MKSGPKPYIEVVFEKEPTVTTYDRSFNKVDTFFSYVGGLIGTIIGLIFILGCYTEKAYEVSISRKLFKNNEDEDIPSSSFNLLYYFATFVIDIFNLFGCEPPNWTKTKMFV